ncbi:TIGR03667 family PPOX class F420-dependent oxidoreductase [Actinocrinis puniceicyclus]|uniref:TIGR03667 family PPOX class F420-dependent oxidoreductase n=1 Tax=Actinocrinis puniceicyclus TaxID=977794 RepID=A0A8J7WQA9_9ACTN|nr:TIGR03667 family PPOX class F420-dependent oxidoreductase [Actinocrinis puniceicyclus]MBS2963529.1 TIGR03667 family PPOX class F420-dependent oxidoreductase [Actinocrinis puniceicyclus]
MESTAYLPAADRERAEARLRHNLMAWLTTVRPDGQPVTVPVWFLLREDDTILLYSTPQAAKLRNIAQNPKVSLALDVCDLGRNVVRLQGVARASGDEPGAEKNPAYLAKYAERIAALFETPERFAARYRAAVVITASRVFV